MKKIICLSFFLLLLISCNKDYPETIYGIKLGKNTKEEFLKAKEDGYLKIDNNQSKPIVNITSSIKAEIDYFNGYGINKEEKLTQLDLNFYEGNSNLNNDYFLNNKNSINEIVDFFEVKYGIIDTIENYSDINDETKNLYYSNETIDIGYGFPKKNRITRQWIVDNLKIRLTTQITEDKKYTANATYFYTDKFQNELRQRTLKKSRDNF